MIWTVLAVLWIAVTAVALVGLIREGRRTLREIDKLEGKIDDITDDKTAN